MKYFIFRLFALRKNEKKMLLKTKTFSITYVTNYSKHFLENECHKCTEGKGAGLHICMRDVSAERSKISI